MPDFVAKRAPADPGPLPRQTRAAVDPMPEIAEPPRVAQLAALADALNAGTGRGVLQRQLAAGAYTTNKDANLRSGTLHYVKRTVPNGTALNVIDKGNRTSNFGLLFGAAVEHSWVRLGDGTTGWIVDANLAPAVADEVQEDVQIDLDDEKEVVPQGPQPGDPVARLKPGFVQGDYDPKWNFEIGSREEQDYNDRGRVVGHLEALQQYASENGGYTVGPNTYAPKQGGVQSDYHRAGEQTRQQFYADAHGAGYDLTHPGVIERLERAAGAYHSATYESMLTQTGILLK